MPSEPPDAFRSGVPLCRWFGVAVRAHWTVLLAIVLFAEVLAASVLPSASPHHSQVTYWLVGTATAAVFLATVLAHEVAHALAARHVGLRVRRITLWAFGGFTEFEADAATPGQEALIAGSGPLASLGLGAICLALALGADTKGLLAAALVWLGNVNIILAVFNLLPGAPLDGGRVLRAALWARSHDRSAASRASARVGRILGLGLVVLGILELVSGGWAGLWVALTGWFILASAAGEELANRTDQLDGITVQDVMAPVGTVAPDWWTVQQFLSTLAPDSVGQRVYPVTGFDGQVVGLVGIGDLVRIAPARRATARIREVVRTGRPAIVEPQLPLSDLMHGPQVFRSAAVVVENGHPVGMVTPACIANAITLADLGWRGHDRASLS